MGMWRCGDGKWESEPASLLLLLSHLPTHHRISFRHVSGLGRITLATEQWLQML